MKRADPGVAQRGAAALQQKRLDAFAHLVGGLIGKGDGQNGIAGYALIDQVGDAVGDDASFAGSGASQDKYGTFGCEDSFTLLRIQIIKKIHRAPEF